MCLLVYVYCVCVCAGVRVCVCVCVFVLLRVCICISYKYIQTYALTMHTYVRAPPHRRTSSSRPASPPPSSRILFGYLCGLPVWVTCVGICTRRRTAAQPHTVAPTAAHRYRGLACGSADVCPYRADSILVYDGVSLVCEDHMHQGMCLILPFCHYCCYCCYRCVTGAWWIRLYLRKMFLRQNPNK